MPSHVGMRQLTEADIPFGMKLKNTAGWNQIEDDWRRFLTLEPEGCFVAQADGEDAGTVTTTRYGDRFGWVGMVLVLPERRRGGIGTALLQKGIAYIESRGTKAVRLDATPMGKKLYDTLDFQDEYHLERKQGFAAAQKCPELPRMSASDLADVIAFDEPIFGANREPMLRTLFEQHRELCFFRRGENGAVDGYVMARPGLNAYQIGPWIATSPEVAESLFATALNALAGSPVFLDVPLVREAPADIVARYAFETQRPFIRMFRGVNAYPGDVPCVYAICGVETG